MRASTRELASLVAARARDVLERLVMHLRARHAHDPELRRACMLMLLRRLVATLAHARGLPSEAIELSCASDELERDGAALADALAAELLDPAPVRVRRARHVVELALPEPGRLPIELLGHVYETWLGSRRKTGGAFYTPPELAEPTVRRTLLPLTHVHAQGTWRARPPEVISALRVCDPAMGSGAFLLAALERLAAALHESLQLHGHTLPDSRAGLRAQVAACLHGVDLDPLAVALARVSLWLAVGDATRSPADVGAQLRCGNALIGCRPAWVGHYPLAAWSREGGDRGHATFVHHMTEVEGERRGDAWTRAIRAERTRIMQELAGVERSTQAPIGRETFDAWCATWFWPADALALAPRPRDWHDPSPDTRRIVARLAESLGFLHWELEFPEVFAAGGFDAVIGNPPWEVQKPNSKEFFSAHDSEYAKLGKQAALDWQRRAFAASPALEHAWIRHQAHHKAFSHWITHTREYQGSADLDSYKLFIELAHALLREGGRLGLIVPSGIYSDKGCASLRALLLDRCNWEWLYAFENREGIFDIHRSFKFAAIVVEKGGCTRVTHTAFMVGDLHDWQSERPSTLALPRSQLARLSPQAHAFVELRDARDLALLEHLHARGVPLGERGEAWDIEYVREFDMTNDSHRFAPREHWAARGHQPDEYGHWLRGPWRPGERDVLDVERVCSREGTQVLDIHEIEDIALPLYQGAMIQQFDFAAGSSWLAKHIEPHSLMARAQAGPQRELKLGFRDIARTTDSRTMIAALLPGMPCGNKVPLLRCASGRELELVAVLDSFVFDWMQRTRQVGSTLNHHVIAEQPLPLPCPALHAAGMLALRLNAAHPIFARTWLRCGDRAHAWRQQWALLPAERLRLRVILDALVAHAYGLDAAQLRHILADCDHPRPEPSRMWTKGFWRVDKQQPPDRRHTVLVEAAFAELERVGLERFLAPHEQPDTTAPVVAASWAECEAHAERLRRLAIS